MGLTQKFSGSGNNVGPIRDLLRRVLTIHIDPRCATPATMSYKGSPVEKVREHRGAYVTAVLTSADVNSTRALSKAIASMITEIPFAENKRFQNF